MLSPAPSVSRPRTFAGPGIPGALTSTSTLSSSSSRVSTRRVLRHRIVARLQTLEDDLDRRRDRHREERAHEPGHRGADQQATSTSSGEIPIVFRMTIGTSTLPSTNWSTT